MADLSTTKLIDLALLTKYDELLKEYIAEEAGSAASSALHTVAVDTTNHTVKFYSETSSEIGTETTPAFTVSFSDIYGDVATLKADNQTEGSVAYQILSATGALGNDKEGQPYANVKAYVDAVVAAATADANGKIGTLTDLTTTAQNTLVAAINEIDADITTLNGADTVDGSVAKAVKTAKESLEGQIGTLADLETDEKGTIVGAINEVAEAVGDLTSDSKVSLATAETATEGYLKTYVLSQGEGEDAVEIGKIDIPKDFVVTKTEGVKIVETEDEPVEGYKVGDKYITLFINTKDATSGDGTPMYIKVSDFAKAMEAEKNATQVQLAISDDNVISATIVDGSVDADAIGADAVVTAKIKDANVTASKLAENSVGATVGEGGVITSTVLDDVVVASLNKAETAVQSSDITIATQAEIEALFAEPTTEGGETA